MLKRFYFINCDKKSWQENERKGVQSKKQTNWSNLTIAEHDIAKKARSKKGACKSHKHNNSPGKVYIEAEK